MLLKIIVKKMKPFQSGSQHVKRTELFFPLFLTVSKNYSNFNRKVNIMKLIRTSRPQNTLKPQKKNLKQYVLQIINRHPNK